MKKLLPLLSVLFLILGCSTETDTLQKRGDLYYEINSDKPFSGLFLDKYESGQNKSKGYVKDGKNNGLWTHWYENGQKGEETNYKDGKQDGFQTIWFESGQRKKEQVFKDGKKNGKETIWYEINPLLKYLNNDSNDVVLKSSEENYKDDKLEGLQTSWYKNGQMKYIKTYKDGKWISSKRWNEDGSVDE